ncbi:MAG: CHC2 zinc finger domain-containing protein [Clostridia bacterium]|nr:CHC2 zinc finger domain-containing protein [Clostridia bacterium]
MTLFETVKAAVSVPKAAEYCGLTIHRGDVCCCPFHSERTPSFKLYLDHYYCFGCHEHGDAINLVAKLKNLSPKDAALLLADAFSVPVDVSPAKKRKPVTPRMPFKPKTEDLSAQLAAISQQASEKSREDWLNHAMEVLTGYTRLLHIVQAECAPTDETEDFHPLFAEAVKQEEYVWHLMELLDNPIERPYFYELFHEEIEDYERAIDQNRLVPAHAG